MTDISTIRSDFIEKVGQITQTEGMPKIAGRVFGLLMFDGTPVSFGDLADELQVSRGSISSSVRLLEDRGVIRRVGMPGERQDFFQMADKPFAGILDTIVKRTKRAGDDIEATVAKLPDGATDVAKRLQSYSNFYRALGSGLGHALDLTTKDERV